MSEYHRSKTYEEQLEDELQQDQVTGDALAACPFCGGEPEIQDHRTIWAVVCTSCGASMLGERAPEPESEAHENAIDWGYYERTAKDRWNRHLTASGVPYVPGSIRELPDIWESLTDSMDESAAGAHRACAQALRNALASAPADGEE